ncbi:hypothetical protein [Aurantibacillus circumpalustris]|uniref:hypothetical protein n=1 Tax=Aurantibacillus circumpalustris TaxID=3036359 RepID=UPI00295BD11F|nr:hypothetical protein [Aurantibacillus circumpalustris]
MKTQIKNQPKGSVTLRKNISGISSFLAIMFVVTALFLSSCRKKEKEVVEVEDTEQSTANDNNVAESYVSDIESIGSQVSENGSLETYRTSGSAGIEAMEAAGCAVITVVGQIITVDFGTTPCVGKDGRSRTGKLIYDFSGSTSGAIRYRNPGFNMSVSSQNYVVNDYTVNITNKTISNITPNSTSNLKWSIAANISIVKPNNAGTVTWTCNRTKELTNTNDTNCYRGQAFPIDWKKAIVKLNGNASGVNAKAENYTSVATDLVRDFNCAPEPVLRPHRHPFISGTVVYTPGSRPVRTIDYGNGACDMTATVTIRNKVFTINLP